MKKSIPKSFKARLERINSPLRWVMIRIPFDAGKAWGKRGQLKVKGEIKGFAFRTSLFPRRNGGHMMLVNKRMQRGASTGPGSVAQFRLEPDVEDRIVCVPVELKRALAEVRSLRQWFGKLNYSMRKYITEWIGDVKSAEARTRRAERLLATMEAERELPPILQIAFEHNAQARGGWERMSLPRRRGHLLGIFYYRNPEARGRQIDKALQDAMELAEKTARKGIRPLHA